MKVSTLENTTENVLLHLLEEDQNWGLLISSLESLASTRKRQPGMEIHHVEPDRLREINLWPLEHLAIHICHAKSTPSNSFNAKVAAFVKPFPGGFRRLLSLPEPLNSLVLNLGQSRPSNKGKGKLQYLHEKKDGKGRSLTALRAIQASSKKRQIPVKVTDLLTGSVSVFDSIKDAAEATGAHRSSLSSYFKGTLRNLPPSVRGKFVYEILD